MKIAPAPAVVNSMTMPTRPAHEGLALAQPAGEAQPKLTIPDANETRAPEASQPLSPQFAELAKRRRALQLQERALKDREKALSSQSTGGGGGIDLELLKSQPLKVLQDAGVTYDQLTEHLLGNQEDAKVRALEAKIEALEQGVEKKFTERDTQAERQVLTEMQREAERLVRQGDSYELVRETRSVPDVMKLIERTYRETGEVLDVDEALQLVEDELFKDVSRYTSLNKIKSQFAPQNTAPTHQPSQQYGGMRTLKNTDTASIPLSRRARALAAWNN